MRNILNKYLDQLIEKELIPLNELIKEDLSAFQHGKLKEHGICDKQAVYCFWWFGSKKELGNSETLVKLKGKKISDEKKYKEHKVTWKTNWFPKGLSRYPLYIGKSTVLASRIKQHLCLSKKYWYTDKSMVRKPRHYLIRPKNNTSCQFRSGFEHLFRGNKMKNEMLLNKVGITFLPIESVAERFYLEDLAIGSLRPWFNLDSER